MQRALGNPHSIDPLKERPCGLRACGELLAQKGFGFLQPPQSFRCAEVRFWQLRVLLDGHSGICSIWQLSAGVS